MAQEQFGEPLPALPDRESLKEKVERAGYWALLVAKSHNKLLMDTIFNFGEARRVCRSYVFSEASVRQEPDMLIESSIWGEFLFPEDVVRTVKESAQRHDKALLKKWGFPERGEKQKGSWDWK